MLEKPRDLIVQDLRLGSGKAFLMAGSGEHPLRGEGATIFSALDQVVRSHGGWLVDDRLGAARPDGFGSLMERRERGEFPWEVVCSRAKKALETPPHTSALATRQPYAMAAAAGFPLWAIRGHVITVDLFNAASELFEAQPGERLWAIHVFPPSLPSTESWFLESLCAVFTASRAHYGFGGEWLAQAVFAYRFADHSDNGYLRPLSRMTRLPDLAYSHMLVDANTIGAEVRTRLEQSNVSVRRGNHGGEVPCVEALEDGRLYFLRSAWMYPGVETHSLARKMASLLAKPYAGDAVLARPEEWP